ncbi:SAICAR synthase-like protein [Abortiporus biennis]|nr:SAICAR synthase-like protein [Abortiporus biennis]
MNTVPLSSQVGGHAGVMTTEDGSLLIKPSLPVEVSFYQSVGTDPGFAPLRPFIPRFYGTLKLEGQVDNSEVVEGGEIKLTSINNGMNKESIVLENISCRFHKPNILDIKLGTILYDDEASPEKRARMEKTARETTSLETGIRLTGFQVYHLESGVPINTPKTYGKSITPADLPEGISRFFPVASPSPTPTKEDETPITGTGLPAKILLPILQSLRQDIADIRDALSQIHMRMVGGSLLVVYEADWERAEEGLKHLEEELEELEAELEAEEDEDEDEDDDEEGKPKKVGMPYSVKLIDFAHTKIVPGEGPDEGVLKGVDTVLTLLDARIAQVKEAL